MKFRKILSACFSLVCLLAFVAGTIGCTNEPPKKVEKKESGAGAGAKPAPAPSSNTT